MLKLMKLLLAGWLLLIGMAHAQNPNYSDLWWNAGESGWGLTIADHGESLFGVWYTYAQDGRPIWFSIPGGSFSADRRTFTGDIYESSGPPHSALPFDHARVTSRRVGNAVLDFAPADAPPGSARFSYTVGNISQSRIVSRMNFGNWAPWWSADLTDLWWNPAESGWGLSLTQHGNNLFGVWYTYDASGAPLFLFLPGVSFDAPNRFSGALYSTTGPWFGERGFDPNRVRVTPVGSVAASFSGNGGVFTATINGLVQSHALTRLSFASSSLSDPNPGGESWRQRNIAVGYSTGTLPPGDGSLIMPEVLLWPDGRYRMYFCGRRFGNSGGDIWLAESTDEGNSWQLRGMVLAGSSESGNPEFQIAGPSLVRLPDGRWRMYYQATPDFDITLSGGAPPRFQMFSAISADGLNWTREGVRIPNVDFNPSAVMKGAAHGRVLPVAGGYMAYLSAKPRGAQFPSGIYRMFSSDGLDFDATFELILPDAHDPLVIKVDGRYLMYADPSPNSGAGSAQNAVLLTSLDGIRWSAPQAVAFLGRYGERLHFGGSSPSNSMGDLGGVVMANGQLRLFSNYNWNDIAYYDRLVFP